MASAAQTAVRRTVKTCTECRQSKVRITRANKTWGTQLTRPQLKCDSKERFPSPCSRCEAKQLFCNVDAAFKRTPAKKSVPLSLLLSLSLC